MDISTHGTLYVNWARVYSSLGTWSRSKIGSILTQFTKPKANRFLSHFFHFKYPLLPPIQNHIPLSLAENGLCMTFKLVCSHIVHYDFDCHSGHDQKFDVGNRYIAEQIEHKL